MHSVKSNKKGTFSNGGVHPDLAMRMHVKESSDKYEMKWKVGMALMFNE
jgi:hypothetical protein